jgi:lysozyme
MNAPPPAPQSSGGGLISLIGAAAAAILVPTVMLWEGTETVPYKDVVGIWTVCTGDTKDVIPGKVYTKAECEERLERQLIAHAKPVLKCVPALKDRPNQLAASVSLAYNIGPTAFCRSTAARRFNAGQWKAGCDAFLSWRYAGGREIRGLLNRRKAEREICLRSL